MLPAVFIPHARRLQGYLVRLSAQCFSKYSAFGLEWVLIHNCFSTAIVSFFRSFCLYPTFFYSSAFFALCPLVQTHIRGHTARLPPLPPLSPPFQLAGERRIGDCPPRPSVIYYSHWVTRRSRTILANLAGTTPALSNLTSPAAFSHTSYPSSRSKNLLHLRCLPAHPPSLSALALWIIEYCAVPQRIT